MRRQVLHSKVRSSKPRLPAEIRANPILCLQVGHIGRSTMENETRMGHSTRTIGASSFGGLYGARLSVENILTFQLGNREVSDRMGHKLSADRPCESRDPSPLASKVKKASKVELRVRAAAMSAIALTLGSLHSQGRLVENVSGLRSLVKQSPLTRFGSRKSASPRRGKVN
jgi:hypothetical protein